MHSIPPGVIVSVSLRDLIPHRHRKLLRSEAVSPVPGPEVR